MKAKALKMTPLIELLASAIKSEIGADVVIVETRKDPKVHTTIAVRTESDGCFLVQVYKGESEVIDCFDLEEGQTSLKNIKVGEPSFF